MGVEKCQLIFSNHPSSTFYAGETVNGHVEFVFNSATKFRGIKAKCLGEANVSWKESSGKTTRHFRAKQEYYNIVNDLMVSETGEQLELPEGKHTFPISFILPRDLPTSFEGKWGYVRYTVKVIIDRPWRFDHQFKFAITVLSVYDLNLYPALKNEVYSDSSKTFCCLCCTTEPFKMRVFLPCTGFAPGQTIPIKVECSNMSPRNVLDLTFSLVKEIRYHAKKPWKKTRTEKSVIAALQTNTGITSGEERTILECLNVPPLPPSELVNCQIIDVLYKIKVEAFVSGMAKNPKNTTFIRIGTVPIYEKMGILNGKAVGYPQTSSSEDPPSYYQAQTQLLNYDMPPPTYEESQYRPNTLHGDDDNEYTNVETKNFAPRYPVYNYNPSAPNGDV